MIRIFDLIFSLFGLIILFPLLILLYIIGFIDTGSPIFKQIRVGYNRNTFFLIKFRTMPVGTKSAATHFIDHSVISKFGYFLRKTKLDEFPQLINVFLPTTPNPTSGFLLMVPKQELIYLEVTFEQASKFIVSAGTSDIN